MSLIVDMIKSIEVYYPSCRSPSHILIGRYSIYLGCGSSSTPTKNSMCGEYIFLYDYYRIQKDIEENNFTDIEIVLSYGREILEIAKLYWGDNHGIV